MLVTLVGYAEDCGMRKVTVREAYPYTFRPLRPLVARGGSTVPVNSCILYVYVSIEYVAYTLRDGTR